MKPDLHKASEFGKGLAAMSLLLWLGSRFKGKARFRPFWKR